MKITDALESVLRLLVATDRQPPEPAAERPLPDWAKRSNQHGAGENKPVEGAVAGHNTAESLETPPPETEEPIIPGLIDSLLGWVQSHDREPTSAPDIEPASAPVSDPDPEPVHAAAEEPDEPAFASQLPVAVDHDVAHLEAAAHVAETLNLGFHLGSAVERIASAAAQGSQGVPSLREAVWLIERYIAIIEKRPLGADLHLTAARLARAGDAIAGLKALAETLDDEQGHDFQGDDHIGRLSPEPPPS